MIQFFLAIIFGCIGLYYGAEWLIKGAGSFALRMGISPVVVGLTIIGYGTSSPELIVSIDSAWNQQPDIALGNVIGSNICNIGLIIGSSLLIRPTVFHRQLARFDGIVMVISAVLLSLTVWWGGVGRIAGIIYLCLVTAYTLYTLQYDKKRGREDLALMEGEVTKKASLFNDCFFMALGLGVLLVGARSFLYGSVEVARLFEVSEAVIGLTLVAVGTSLPELATSALAAWRGKSDIAVGNIVGSNIYNILGILGIVGVIAPIDPRHIHFLDFAVMLGFTLVFYGMIWRGKKSGRLTGALLLGAYLVYVIALYER